MGRLIDYLMGLPVGAEIDSEILDCCNSVRSVFVTERINWVYSQLGLYKYRANYVPWIAGKIAYGEIYPATDFISRPFSGCYMVTYTGEDHNRYGAHIHRGTDGAYTDQKENWNEYVRGLCARRHNFSATLFKPTVLIETSTLKCGEELWGIISQTDTSCCALRVLKKTVPGKYLKFKLESRIQNISRKNTERDLILW